MKFKITWKTKNNIQSSKIINTDSRQKAEEFGAYIANQRDERGICLFKYVSIEEVREEA